MPKAEADDGDCYDLEIADHKATLEMCVNDCEWVVKFTTLLVLYAGVSTVFVLLLKRAFEHGLDIRLAFGVIATFAIAWLLFFPTARAVAVGTQAILMKLRKMLRIPFGIEHHNVVFRATWLSIINTLEITAMWGTGILGSELVKNAGLQ